MGGRHSCFCGKDGRFSGDLLQDVGGTDVHQRQQSCRGKADVPPDDRHRGADGKCAPRLLPACHGKRDGTAQKLDVRPLVEQTGDRFAAGLAWARLSLAGFALAGFA